MTDSPDQLAATAVRECIATAIDDDIGDMDTSERMASNVRRALADAGLMLLPAFLVRRCMSHSWAASDDALHDEIAGWHAAYLNMGRTTTAPLKGTDDAAG